MDKLIKEIREFRGAITQEDGTMKVEVDGINIADYFSLLHNNINKLLEAIELYDEFLDIAEDLDLYSTKERIEFAEVLIRVREKVNNITGD